MQPMYYIGLDVHKRMISYCVKDGSGKIHAEGAIPASRFDLVPLPAVDRHELVWDSKWRSGSI